MFVCACGVCVYMCVCVCVCVCVCACVNQSTNKRESPLKKLRRINFSEIRESNKTTYEMQNAENNLVHTQTQRQSILIHNTSIDQYNDTCIILSSFLLSPW